MLPWGNVYLQSWCDSFFVLQAFAQFANAMSAQAAKDAIHGRLFAGSTVEVNYITAQQFGAVGGFQ